MVSPSVASERHCYLYCSVLLKFSQFPQFSQQHNPHICIVKRQFCWVSPPLCVCVSLLVNGEKKNSVCVLCSITDIQKFTMQYNYILRIHLDLNGCCMCTETYLDYSFDYFPHLMLLFSFVIFRGTEFCYTQHHLKLKTTSPLAKWDYSHCPLGKVHLA